MIFDSCNGKYAAISYFFLQTVVLINMSMKVYCHSKYNYLVPFLLYSIRLSYPSIGSPHPHRAHGPPLKSIHGGIPPKTVDPVEAAARLFPTHWTVSLGVGKACIYVLNLNPELTLEG